MQIKSATCLCRLQASDCSDSDQTQAETELDTNLIISIFSQKIVSLIKITPKFLNYVVQNTIRRDSQFLPFFYTGQASKILTI